MIELVEFHSFLPILKPGDKIVDLGANKGNFSKKMADKFGVDCVAVEANPHLMPRLTDLNAAYNLAITGECGEVSISVSKVKTARSVISDAGSVKVKSMDLEAFIEHAEIEKIDLLKCDIEGAEIDMFASCTNATLQKIPQITIEFHDFTGKHYPTAKVMDIVNRLKGLGFFYCRFSRVGHQDTLFVNTNLIPLTTWQKLYIKYFYRNAKGLSRMLRKRVMGRNWHRGYS